jgi:hypothetical protein
MLILAPAEAMRLCVTDGLADGESQLQLPVEAGCNSLITAINKHVSHCPVMYGFH